MKIGYLLIIAIASTAIPISEASPTDKIFLTDGQIISGNLSDPAFRFRTNYGEITIPNHACDRIVRHKEKIERLYTVNGERISGFVSTNITINISGGPVIDIQKHLIEKVVFGSRRETPADGLDYFMMKMAIHLKENSKIPDLSLQRAMEP